MYSERVLLGFWFNKRQLELEKRELLKKKRDNGEMLYQRVRRLTRALDGPVFGLRVRDPGEDALKFGQMVQLHCPEIEELVYLLEGHTGCPYDEVPKGPGALGLVLAATASLLEAELATTDRITDGCPLACTPRRKPSRRSVFVLKPGDNGADECLRFGQDFFLQLAYNDEELYLRSEAPLLDGKYGPNYHNPLRLNLFRDCYAKWRAFHWNKNKRFETEASPIMPCKRVIIQHVMTGKCLAVESFNWHHSILGFECGASVHSYKDVHRNETSKCIWNMLVVEKDDGDYKNINNAPVKCSG